LFGEGDVTEKLFGHYAVVIAAGQELRAMADDTHAAFKPRGIPRCARDDAFLIFFGDL
jgi:hypothetical protein